MQICFLRVFAHDEDEGKNGEIRYSITEGNEQNIVRIDRETGSIFAMENATWNDSQTIILTVKPCQCPRWTRADGVKFLCYSGSSH